MDGSCRHMLNSGRYCSDCVRAALDDTRAQILRAADEDRNEEIRSARAAGAAAERERLRGLTNPKADEFLTWIADRVVHVYGESDMVDFVHALRRLAAALSEVAE